MLLYRNTAIYSYRCSLCRKTIKQTRTTLYTTTTTMPSIAKQKVPVAVVVYSGAQ